MNILLIAGGWSTERDVSLNGAKAVEKTLLSDGHEVTFFDLRDNFDDLLEQASLHEFAFINLHGAPGEDGLIQAMLDNIGCPYQGSGAASSFVALNKSASKQIYRSAGLKTPDWQFVPPNCFPKNLNLSFPLFVKSNTGGSSLRLGRVQTEAELHDALEEIFSANEGAIIEKAIAGRDLTCGVLGREALPPVLIEPLSGEFFNYESKYANGGAKEICPAPVEQEVYNELQKLALQAHVLLGLQGYSRSDFILDKENQLYILESNTLPGMTATSLVPQEARQMGLSFPELLNRLIELGLKDHPPRK